MPAQPKPVAGVESSRAGEIVEIVALITSSTVRMGASVVAMSLRALGSPVEIRVVGNVTEARAALESPLP